MTWPETVTVRVNTFDELQARVRAAVAGRSAIAFRGYHSISKEALEQKPERAYEALVPGLESACLAIDGTLERVLSRERVGRASFE